MSACRLWCLLLFSVLPEILVADTGTLVICGGGSLPDAVISRFVQLAEGPSGHLVVIPTASTRTSEAELSSLIQLWRERGMGRVSILHTTDRQRANTPEFAEVLDEATAVWIGGGQQSRLAAVYQGTETEQRLQQFVAAGKVIGGTSAGAAIQSRVMIQSGNPVPTLSTGFDLLPGAIIDQHFLRRNRFNRLLTAVRKHPDRQGVGIAEGTALVFQDGRCEVLGRSFVVVVTPPNAQQQQPLAISTWRAGDTFPFAVQR